MEITVLKILEDKEKAMRYKAFLKTKAMSQEASTVYQAVQKWHEQSDSFDWDAFSEWFFCALHPTFKPEKAEMYREYIQRIKNAVLEPDAPLMQALCTRDYANRIAFLADQVAEDALRGDLSDVQDLLESWGSEMQNTRETDLEDPLDLSEIMDSRAKEPGLNWRLTCLNKSLGPLRKGDIGLFGARPECGKTTMLASEVSFMCKQLLPGERVLWFNNEETSSKVTKRVYQAAIGWTNAQIEADKAEATRLASSIKGRFNIIPAHGMDLRAVEQYCKRYKPRLMIFDQLRKMEHEGEGVDKLHKLYYTARTLARDWCPVIIVHQAGGDAEGQMWLKDTQLYGCLTEVQAELDFQVMMGAADKASPDRGLNVVKNKLDGGADTEEVYRHCQFNVKIEPTIARFSDSDF